MADKKKKDAEAKDKAGKKDKDEKKDKKGKKGKKGAEDGAPRGGSIANHPRARGSIRRIKAWTGLAGFAIAAVLSLKAGVPTFDAGLRALGAGVIGYMLAWWFSVRVWQQLIIAEQKAHYAALEKQRDEQADKPAAERPRTPAAQPQPST
jgi:hypothetical protein